MKFSKNPNYRNIFFLFLLVIIMACTGKKEQQKKQAPTVVQELAKVDGQYLFDGNTLKGWELTQFGPQGPVDVYDGKIILNYGDGCTGVTFTEDFPKINYEVNLEAQKTSGNDFFCGITFPVNDDFCSLIIGGWGGAVVGLSVIDGEDASENETKILKRFDKDVWYKIKLHVDNEKIVAWIDGEKMIDFLVAEHQLSIRPEVELSKPFGICTWMTTGELRNIWLKKL